MKRKMQKVTTLFVVLAFVVSMLGSFSTVFAAKIKQFTAVDGSVMIEAEDTVDDSKLVTIDKSSSASGKKAVTLALSDRETPSQDRKGGMSFEILSDKAGTYNVWVRMVCKSGGNDSTWVSVNGGDYTNTALKIGAKDENDYQWSRLTKVSVTAGKASSVRIIPREIGAVIDAFFVTTDDSKLPIIEGVSTTATTAPSATPSSKPSTEISTIKQFTAEEGSVMFEAEDVVDDSKLVTKDKSSSASGKKAVTLALNDRETPSQDRKGGMSFGILSDKGGTYNVWVRMVCMSQANDSVWVSVNGGNYNNPGLKVGAKDENDYQWSILTTVSVTAGKASSVRIIPREIGAVIDKFIVTNVSGFTPKDMGELPVPGEINIVPLPSDKYPLPTITPPPEHPRLMFRKSDIPTIKANWDCAENAAAAEEYKNLLATNTDGNVVPNAKGGTFNAKVLGAVEAMAFEYAINGDEAMGKQAILAIKNFISNVNYAGEGDPVRSIGQMIYAASEVYDWCYPLMTNEDKKWIVSNCESQASGLEVGWPPNRMGAVCGHGSEAQLQRDLLSFGIATYDEYPDIYNYVAGRYLSEYLATRNFWAPAGTQHQGAAYGIYRRTSDLLGQWLIYRMTGDKVFIEDFGKVDYQWLYTRRPDGELIREGDDYNQSNGSPEVYWNIGTTPMFYSSAFYKDPYIKKEFLKQNGLASFDYIQQFRTPVDVLLFNDPSVGAEPVGELPKTKYFASPLGQMIARTGWNDGVKAPDTIAFMKIGEIWAANHNHLDAGTFQLYYKGMVASESGWYDSYSSDHDFNYHKRTIAHNALLVYDPDEPSTNFSNREANDGGQRFPLLAHEPRTYEQWIESGDYETGKVLAHEFGPDTINPEYSYISGDITKAYSDKVSEVRRSMLFMPNDNPDFPATFIVFDKVTAKDASFKKTFLLHSQEEITTSGNVAKTQSTDGGHNGMLTNQTLLPKSANLTVIGGEGKEFMVNGKNYEPTRTASASIEVGWGRLEVSPSTASETDYFLNAMYVNDADKTLEIQKADLIESDAFYGAKILGKAAIFGKDKERVTSSATFTIPGNESEMKIAVAGIKEGTWSVSVGGNEIAKEIASADGGIIYFTGPAGEYTLKYVDANADKKFIESEAPQLEGIDIRVDYSYIYTDVPATVIDDRTLVPMRAIFEELGATLSYDDATATATAVRGSKEIKLTENNKTAYVNGKEVELDVPAMMISDRFMVPIRFVSEAMGAKVDWDKFTGAVIIKKGRPATIPVAQTEGYAMIVESSCDEYSELYYDTNSWDGLPETIWSANGNHWVNYEFDKEYTVTGFEVWLNPKASRIAVFDIWTSEDGENWTKIYDGKGDTKNPDTWEVFKLNNPVTTKYMRYYAHGSDISMWNALKEIRFAIQK